MDTLENSTIDTFLAMRPRLLSIAVRVLGDRADAEDTVQEAWIRWQNADLSSVRNAEAFLCTITRRLALNLAMDAAHRHAARFPGEDTEPVDTTSPEQLNERQEAIERCLMVVLRALAPRERAVFLLREAFEVSYSEIGRKLGQSEPAVRQLMSRARRKLQVPSIAHVDRAEHRKLVHAFRYAVGTGDRSILEWVLRVRPYATPGAELALAS